MDFAIVKFFNLLGHGTILDDLSVVISYNGGYFPILLFLCLVVLFRDKLNGKKIFLAAMLAVALHFAVSDWFFKEIVPHFFEMRERPYIAHPQEIFPLGKLNTSASFPSNHMSVAVAILGVLVVYYRRYWKWAVGFVILMAFSRMHNGMHYPMDVFGGIVLGLIYSQLAVWLVEKYLLKVQSLFSKE